MKRLRLRNIRSMVSVMRGVRRSGPCIMGGVSPSLRHAPGKASLGQSSLGGHCPLVEFAIWVPEPSTRGRGGFEWIGPVPNLTKGSRRTPWRARPIAAVCASSPEVRS